MEDKKLTKTEIAKIAVGYIVGSGAYIIATSIIKDHVAPETMPQKVKVYAGTFVLAAVVSSAATKYTDNAIDSLVSICGKVKANLKEAKNS